MDGIATVTQRGQVVIPQPIREFFGLKPADKLYFEIEDNKIVAQPILSVRGALGMIKPKKIVSKREYKKAIAEAVVKKFKQE